MATEGYTLQQLQEMTGVPLRSLRDWVHRKLLPRPAGKGRAARYSQKHVALAKALRTLSGQGLTLLQARARLERMTLAQLEAIAAESGAAGPSEIPTPPPAPQYPFVAWEVISLTHGMVLMLDPRRGPVVRRIADEIYRYCGEPTQARGSLA